MTFEVQFDLDDKSLVLHDTSAAAAEAAAERAEAAAIIAEQAGLSADVKQALLQIAQKVAYIDEDGQEYYDALYDALYPPVDLVSISAVYTQSGTVYDTDSLDSLRSDLVVTASYSTGTSAVVTAYTLSGTLSVGTSTVTVAFGGMTTTFNVVVSVPSRLPSEYQEVEYIQSNGTQEIVTDIIPRDTETDVTFEFVDFITGHDNFITGEWNNSNRYYAAWLNSSGYLVFHNRSNTVMWTGPQYPTGVHTIVYNNTSHQAIYDDEVKATSSDFAVTGGTNPISIFSRSNDAQYASKAKIYQLKYTNNTTGEIIGEFVPCYRKADDVVGMYDLVTEQFYTDSLGGDPLTKGNDVV